MIQAPPYDAVELHLGATFGLEIQRDDGRYAMPLDFCVVKNCAGILVGRTGGRVMGLEHTKALIQRSIRLLPILLLLIAVLVFFTLDLLNFWGRYLAPAPIGRISCAIFPYLTISRPVIARALLNFVHVECLGQPREPTFSIVFFMIKISLSLYLLPILAFADPVDRKRSQDFYRGWIAAQGWRSTLKSFGYGLQFVIGILLVAFLDCSIWVLPGKFGTTVGHKLIEDGLCIFFLLFGPRILAGLWWLAVLALRSRP